MEIPIGVGVCSQAIPLALMLTSELFVETEVCVMARHRQVPDLTHGFLSACVGSAFETQALDQTQPGMAVGTDIDFLLDATSRVPNDDALRNELGTRVVFVNPGGDIRMVSTEVMRPLGDSPACDAMTRATSPYGEDNAAESVLDLLTEAC